jgi:tRNA(Arg) A34 adenosine deaminase TadA
MLSEISFQLPDWTKSILTTSSKVFSSVEDRQRFVIDLARQNVQRQTGGPFAAAVFDDDGRLIALGVNIVVISNCSVLHAEIVALILAQRALNRYDLSDGGRLRYDP